MISLTLAMGLLHTKRVYPSIELAETPNAILARKNASFLIEKEPAPSLGPGLN
jgi:hypothetical protein